MTACQINMPFWFEANGISIIGMSPPTFSSWSWLAGATLSSSPPADCSNKSVISGQPAVANPHRIYEPRNRVPVHPLTSSTVVCPPVLPFSPPFSGENQILMQKCAHMVSISGWFPWGSSAPRKITSNSTRLTHLRSTWTLSHREFDPTTEMTYTVQRLVWRMFLSSSLSSGVVSHLCSLTSPLTRNFVFLLL